MKWAGSTQALAASSTPGWCLGLDYRLGGFPAPAAQGDLGGGVRDDFVLVSVSGAEVSLGQPSRLRGAAKCRVRGRQGQGRGQPVSKLSPVRPLPRWGS